MPVEVVVRYFRRAHMATLHAQLASGGIKCRGNKVQTMRDSNIDLTEGSQRDSCSRERDEDLLAQKSGQHRPREATPEASSYETRVGCELVELLQVMLGELLADWLAQGIWGLQGACKSSVRLSSEELRPKSFRAAASSLPLSSFSSHKNA